MWGDQSKTGWSILCVFQSRFAFMTLAVCIEPLSLTQLTNRKLCQSLHYVLQMTVETFLVVFPDFLHILKMLCTKNFSFRFIIDSSSIRFVATDFQSSPVYFGIPQPFLSVFFLKNGFLPATVPFGSLISDEASTNKLKGQMYRSKGFYQVLAAFITDGRSISIS